MGRRSRKALPAAKEKDTSNGSDGSEGDAGRIFLTELKAVQAIETLYADGLRPHGRVLLQRARELAAEESTVQQGLSPDSVDPESMPLIDPKHLRTMCETMPELTVSPEFGREFSVVFKDRPDDFLDIRSTEDPYSEELWTELGNYFNALSNDVNAEPLPGSRYACARLLKVNKNLPLMQALTLGQVCHVLQLAISKRQLLGYHENRLVPYSNSGQFVKDQCALQMQPISTVATSRKTARPLPVASRCEAKMGLLELFDSESDILPLSNVKRLFRARFRLELSETSLGHSRLQGLLQDPYFADILLLQAAGSGQHFVRRADANAPDVAEIVWPGLDCIPDALQDEVGSSVDEEGDPAL